MRYFFIDGNYIPKHCIYGPRPREATFFEPWEWFTINDTLYKNQRERAVLEMYAAKEQKKKDMSHDMTKNWQNTLTSIKTQSEQRRIEEKEKEKQSRIDEYNRIIQNRKEEKASILEGAKRLLFEEKDEIKVLNEALIQCYVLAKREEQIEMKKSRREEEKKKEAAFAERVRRDVEAYREEQKEAERRAIAKRDNFRSVLIEQINDRKKLSELEAEEKRRRETIDMKKMRERLEKLEACGRQKKVEGIKRTKALYEKGYHELQLEKTRAIEEEEECVLNSMYNEYAKKFQKARAEKEKGIIQESILRRKLQPSRENQRYAEEETYQKAMREREEAELKIRREKQEEERKSKAEMEKWKADLKERREAEEQAERDRLKWTIAQNRWKKEVDRMRKEEAQRKNREGKSELKEAYDMQRKEAEEAEKAAKERDSVFLERPCPDGSRIQEYCDEVLRYAREHNYKMYPLLAAAANVRQSCKAHSADVPDERSQQNKCNKPTGTFGFDCYCFKN